MTRYLRPLVIALVLAHAAAYAQASAKRVSGFIGGGWSGTTGTTET